MVCLNLPKAVRVVIDRVKDLEKKISHATWCSLLCFFLFNCKSLSDVARRLPFSMSVSTMAYAAKIFPFNRFRRRLMASVLRKYGGNLDPENFVFIIDDTDNPKWGKFSFSCGRWKGSKGHYTGQKVMVLALVDLTTHVGIPIAYEILPKRLSKADPSAIDYVPELIKSALNAGYPKLTVVADSWFSSADLMAKIESLGCHFVVEIKSNRKVKTNPGANVAKVCLPDAFGKKERQRTVTSWDSKARQNGEKTGKVIAAAHLQINKRTKPLKCIAVYNRKNNLSAFAYYASTDRSMSRARIWMLSRARWAIECIFRTVKQWLSFGRLSCAGENAAHLAVAMPFYLYGLLRLEEPSFWGLEKLESVDRMLAKIQEGGFDKALEIMLNNPNHQRVKILRDRRCKENVNRKPCTKPAGRLKVA